MILSAQSIRWRCVKNKPPLIDPFVERDVSPGGKSFGLSAASYDVRLDQRLRLPPRGFALASTMERFCMPFDVAATVRDKSSWARVGLAVQNTHLDPGWSGWLTLEISNNSLDEVIIDAGEPIAQIVFEILDFPTEQPYGGKYQNQERGPQPARRDQANSRLTHLTSDGRLTAFISGSSGPPLAKVENWVDFLFCETHHLKKGVDFLVRFAQKAGLISYRLVVGCKI